jgi:prepilin-type N-terminal cleavage/methylation domain-containing protein
MRTQTRRTGFTLIELLVVIAIIAVLAALTISATMRLVGSQQESNTQTLMQHVDRALQQGWAKVINDAKSEDISGAATVLALAGNDQRRARVIWIKLRLMEAFPVSYAECNAATNPLYNPAINLIPTNLRKNISTYQKMLNSAPSHTLFPNSESAACLLMALSMNRGGGAFLNKDVLGSNVVDTDNDGVKEIVDGWGTPLFFYRFPAPALTLPWVAQEQQVSPALSNYGLGALAGVPAFSPPSATIARNALFADPLDPDGTLMDPTWFGTPALFLTTGLTLRQAFEQLCHPIVSPIPIVLGGTPNYPAFYITPVIVSAGSNGKYSSLANVGPTTALNGLGLVGNLTAANSQASPKMAPTYATPTSMSIDVANVNGNSKIPDDANDNIYSFQLRSGGTGN